MWIYPKSNLAYFYDYIPDEIWIQYSNVLKDMNGNDIPRRKGRNSRKYE